MGTPSIIYKYPLDLSGVNPNNLILGEQHTLPVGQNRAIVPNYGAFFATTLVVRDLSSGQVLIPRIQFKAVQLYTEATQRTGQEITSIIVVTDPAVSSRVAIDYQVLGGDFSYSVSALEQMLTTLNLDSRPVEWGDLIGTPTDYPPSPHLHDAGDLYGFEYLVEAVEAVRQAILVGNEGVITQLRSYIAEVDLKALPKANIAEAVEGLIDDKCITPATLKYAFEDWFSEKVAPLITTSSFVDHMSQTNPHGDSANTLGLTGASGASFITVSVAKTATVDYYNALPKQ